MIEYESGIELKKNKRSERMLPEDLKNEIIDRVVEVAGPTRIILFGSHARGEGGVDSDVDLLILIRNAVPKRELSLRVYRALKGIGVAKDVVITTSEEFAAYKDVVGTLFYDAAREGQVIYDEAA